MKKYKLAFSTLGCPDWTFEKILSEAKRLGYTSVEIRGIGPNLGVDTIPELQKLNRVRTKSMLDDAGISICVIGCSAAFSKPDALDSSLSEGKFAIEAASELGIPYIRVFGDRIFDSDSVKNAAKGISMLCDYAADKNVKVLLEAHGDFNTSQVLNETAELIGRDNFGILWDIEHTNAAGESDSDFLNRLSVPIYHVHLKDIDKNGKLCLPGDGILDLTGAADLLMGCGYNGLFSLEWEKRWKRELADPEIAFDKFINVMQG
jgi:sugar phosphate isomerase/epimerase